MDIRVVSRSTPEKQIDVGDAAVVASVAVVDTQRTTIQMADVSIVQLGDTAVVAAAVAVVVAEIVVVVGSAAAADIEKTDTVAVVADGAAAAAVVVVAARPSRWDRQMLEDEEQLSMASWQRFEVVAARKWMAEGSEW